MAEIRRAKQRKHPSGEGESLVSFPTLCPAINHGVCIRRIHVFFKDRK